MKRRSLGDQMSAIVSRHQSCVKMFPRDIRAGRVPIIRTFQEESLQQPMTLSVQKVEDDRIRNNNKRDGGIWTICTDISSKTNGEHKVILFRGHVVSEIKVGYCLKVYPPWKSHEIEGIPCEVITGADFYEILSRNSCSSTDADSNNNSLQKNPVLQSLIETLSTIPCTSGLHNSFVNLLPSEAYSREQMKTLRNQFMKNCGRTEISLNRVELLKWNRNRSEGIFKEASDRNTGTHRSSAAVFIVKLDPNCHNYEDFQLTKCLPKSIISFDKLEVLKKLNKSENPEVFSVVRVLLQNEASLPHVIYKLKLPSIPDFKAPTVKTIKGVYEADCGIQCDRKFIHEIRQMIKKKDLGDSSSAAAYPTNTKRVCVECLLVTEVTNVQKKNGFNSSPDSSSYTITIKDRLGDFMEIHCVGVWEADDKVLISHEIADASGSCSSSSSSSFIAIDFLRISTGGGAPILDEFTSIHYNNTLPIPPSSSQDRTGLLNHHTPIVQVNSTADAYHKMCNN